MRKFWLGLLPTAALMFTTNLSAQEPGELFDKLDANKDGVITSDEVPDDKQATFERLVRSGDANGDKKLTKDELIAGLKKLQQAADAPPAGDRPGAAPGGLPMGAAKEIFGRLDRDGNGKLEKDEIPERMKENLARIDANSDGIIELAEFEKVAQFFGGRRPDAAPGEGQRPDGRFAEQMFDRADSNSDGKITKDEIPEGRQELFDRIAKGAGATGDTITKEQFVKGMLAMAQNAGGRPNQPEGRPGQPGPVPGGPVLRALDADGDGEISASELADAAKSLAKLDRNGDGKLTRDEIGPPPGPGGDRPNVRPGEGNPAGRPAAGGGAFAEEFIKRLKEADKNGDGKISKEEAPDRLQQNFDRIDTNGDGQLDEAELKELVARMRQAGGGDQPRRRPDAEPKKE